MCTLCVATCRDAELPVVAGFSCSGVPAPDSIGTPGETGFASNSVIVNPTGIGAIDGLLSGVKWGLTTLTVQYVSSAASYGPNYGNGEASVFAPITTEQATAFNFAFSLVADYVQLSFVAGNETSANIRVANKGVANSQSVGYYPDGFGTMGDIWMGKLNDGSAGPITNPLVGGFNWATHLHELGHALGLSHGHENGISNGGTASQSSGATIPNTGALPTSFDDWNFSLMTYRSYSGAATSTVQGNLTSDNPITFMPLDILALQHMYGANFGGASSGNTTYRWDTNGFYSVNGVVQLAAAQATKMLMTVWDGGGIDTYDFSLHSSNQTISLQPGAFSTFNTAQLADLDRSTAGVQAAFGNVANAFQFNADPRSLIENVIAGSGNDTIVGNATNNVLNGGAGNDILSGLAGADQLNGGDGADVADYSASSSAVSVSLATLNGWTGDAAGDVLFNIETLRGSNHSDFLVGNDLANVIEGGLGSDAINALGGNDFVTYEHATMEVYVTLAITNGSGFGGEAFGDSISNVENIIGSMFNDQLFGNSEANILRGGAGADVLFGDNNSDTVDYSTSASAVQVNLSTNSATGGDAQGDTLVSMENVFGTAFNDSLVGDSASNTLVGWFGVDALTGNGGNDIFRWSSTAESGTVFGARDVVTDFNRSHGDLFDFSGIDAVTGGADNAFTFIGSAGFTGAGQLRFFFEGPNTVIAVDTNGDGTADMEVQLTGNINLVASDFIL